MKSTWQYDLYLKGQDPTPRISVGRHKRVVKFGETTVLSDYVRTAAECGVEDPVVWGNGAIAWTSVETPEEVETRVAHNKKAAQKHIDAIKEMYEEYKSRGLYDESV